MERVHVIGASGRSGAAIVAALQGEGIEVVPVVRDPARWAGEARIADVTNDTALRAALAGASHVVSTAHARHAGAIIAAAPVAARLVLMGSTRKFTRWPDDHGNGVIEGERALLGSGRCGMMLHPTMIYGAAGEDNARRLARILRWLPMVPLPRGGRALVQPIHQSDVTRAVLAALALDGGPATSLVIAGPSPLPYADFALAVAGAAGLRRPRVVAVPGWVALAGARLSERLPGLPTVHVAEMRRMMEDKAFDITPMRRTLNVEPISLMQGLAMVQGQDPGKLGRTMGFEPTTSKTTTWRSTN